MPLNGGRSIGSRAWNLAIRALTAAPILAALAGVAGCRTVPRPPTFEGCLQRPHGGYATPALKLRLKQCALLLPVRARPASWQLVDGFSARDPGSGRRELE